MYDLGTLLNNSIMNALIAIGLLTVALIAICIILHAGYKQRPRVLIIAFAAIAVITLTYINSGPASHDPQSITVPIWMELIIGFIVSIVPIAMLFYLARLIGKKRNIAPIPTNFSILDSKILAATIAIGIGATLVASAIGIPKSQRPSTYRLNTASNSDILTPITPDIFFDTSGLQNPATTADIQATETRLNRSLPQILKTLYARANGGNMRTFYLPTGINPNNWRVAMGNQAPGLLSLAELRPFLDDVARLNLDTTVLSEAAKNWIIIGENNLFIMFLDYSNSLLPQLGLMKLTDSNNIMKFNSIDAFFSIAGSAER